MTRELTAFEVVKIAEQMEQNAARFYRRAAGMYEDPALSKLFSELAQWEKRHVQVFAEMKGQFPEQAWESDHDRVDVSQLDAPPAVFDGHREPTKELTGNETRAEVFNLALKKGTVYDRLLHVLDGIRPRAGEPRGDKEHPSGREEARQDSAAVAATDHGLKVGVCRPRDKAVQ